MALCSRGPPAASSQAFSRPRSRITLFRLLFTLISVITSGGVFCTASSFVLPKAREARRHDFLVLWRFEHRESRERWDRSKPSNGRRHLPRDQCVRILDSNLCTTACHSKRAFRLDRSAQLGSAPGSRVAGVDAGRDEATADSGMQEPLARVPHVFLLTTYSSTFCEVGHAFDKVRVRPGDRPDSPGSISEASKSSQVLNT